MTTEESRAPSTDEGEARWVRAEESPDIVVWRAVRREVLPYVEMPKSLEAAIRAPLEERIRELEAQEAQFRAAFSETEHRHGEAWAERTTERDEARAEVERLREALRTYLAAHDVWSDREHIIDRVAAANEYVNALDNLRALATPLSSTEGTK